VRVLATFNETEAGAKRAGGHRGDFTLPLHVGVASGFRWQCRRVALDCRRLALVVSHPSLRSEWGTRSGGGAG
jgi:hypothetical protein